MIYDIILTGIVGALYASVIAAAIAVFRTRSKATKGNPFKRQFKDHELLHILHYLP